MLKRQQQKRGRQRQRHRTFLESLNSLIHNIHRVAAQTTYGKKDSRGTGTDVGKMQISGVNRNDRSRPGLKVLFRLLELFSFLQDGVK